MSRKAQSDGLARVVVQRIVVAVGLLLNMTTASHAQSQARNPGMSEEGRGSAKLLQARAALAASDIVRARILYEALTHEEPDNAMAFAGLGMTRVKLDDMPGAIAAYESAVLLAPNLVALQVALGRTYAMVGRRGEARASFEHALSLQADLPAAIEGLRALDMAAGQLPTSAPSAASGFVASPSAAPGFVASPSAASGFWASPSAASGFVASPSAASGSMMAASGADPAEAMRNSARGLYQAGRYGDALAAYQKAANLAPAHAGTYAAIGACYLALRDVNHAVMAYETATRLAPDNAALHAALGRALASQGDPESARGAYERALSLDPTQPTAKDGLAQLDGKQVSPSTPAALQPSVASAGPRVLTSRFPKYQPEGGVEEPGAATAQSALVLSSDAKRSTAAPARPAPSPAAQARGGMTLSAGSATAPVVVGEPDVATATVPDDASAAPAPAEPPADFVDDLLSDPLGKRSASSQPSTPK